MIIALTRPDGGAARAEAHTGEDRTLDCNGRRQPSLKSSAYRGGCGRNPEEMRRYIIVTAVKAPYASIGISLIFLSDKESMHHDVLEGVPFTIKGSQFKME